MSKFSNLLKLITLLKSNKRMKRKDIANALGVSERMVRKYISDLIEANINIESIAGPQGGYELKGYDYLINLNINNDEKEALNIALKELRKIDKSNEYLHKLESINEKINASSFYKKDQISSTIYQSNPIYLEKEKDFELELQSACITRNKIRVSYHSISSGDSIRILRPYTIISRNNMKYLIAYCEERNSERTFKLVRINWIEVLPETFEIDIKFDIKEYMKNTIGIFNGEEIDLKLLIRKPFSYSVSERIYVENQKIKWDKKNETIVFEAKMSEKQDIIKWILSMGEAVTVIEPIELKDEIKNILRNMIDII